jgi:hypothetical protein
MLRCAGSFVVATFRGSLEQTARPTTRGSSEIPPSFNWQNQWHGDLPKPKHILRVASQIVRRGGLIGILHIIVIPAYKEFGVERIALHPILCGPNNAMRVFNVFRKGAAPTSEAVATEEPE